MISGGVLAGAYRPYQALGRVAGNAGLRHRGQLRERRRAFRRRHRDRAQLPAFDQRRALATVVNITWIWPPIRSVMAGAAPL